MGLARACGILCFPQLFTGAAVVLSLVVFLSGYKGATGLKNVHFMTLDFSDLQIDGVSLASLESAANISQIYTVGCNGYCYGSKGNSTNSDSSDSEVVQNIINSTHYDLKGCVTPEMPYWFNFEDLINSTALVNLEGKLDIPSSIDKYNNIAKNVSLAMWACWIVAIIVGAIQFLLGFSAMFSRVGSCCTMLIGGLTGLATGLAAALGTGLYAVYANKFTSVTSDFGVRASVDASGLGLAWAAVVCTLLSDISWTFISCCCGSPRTKYRTVPNEKEPMITYQPYEPHPTERW